MLEDARRATLERVRGVGGIGVIPRNRRAASERTPRSFVGELTTAPRRLTAALHGLATAPSRLRDLPRPDPRAQWRRLREVDHRALLRKHRVLLVGLLAVIILAAADSPVTWGVSDQTPDPDRAQRVAFAYPQQFQSTPPSVRRYLNAIANGERIREQAVVAAAARATLERARAEAAAAVAGERQDWMNVGVAPLPPGSIAPGVGGFVLPARGAFTSGFGSRWGTFHNGIDIAGPIGTPIYAVAAGTVIDAGPAQGFGLWVRIRHDDGAITVYGHMYDFFVSVGERVPAGMQIARMGNRGDSTGPHLHFEVIQNGQHVDPAAWLAQRGLGLN
ncbi:M23 family metallopeptidase [Nocardia bovistercoris]|uniref:M23 family metallopeptidase n=1 Tax=Nocardia bovistercoris TaxID=2785916 RepID=A0A931IHU6_9NOCA|nr:M23 family metallopeptidase [Nocardia bovistercoris]MBH0780645.1 M23 family metallopeptidase [Nocardia bovistercoris]